MTSCQQSSVRIVSRWARPTSRLLILLLACSGRLAGKAASFSPSRMEDLRNRVRRDKAGALPTPVSTPKLLPTSNRRCGTSWSISAASAE